MPATAPAQLSTLYCAAFNDGDLKAIVALYEPDALLKRPGRDVRGTAAIRETFRETLATTKISGLELDSAVESLQGDLCLCVSRWKFQRKQQSSPASATTLEVSRRQSDGTWKLLIDDPITLNSAASSRDR